MKKTAIVSLSLLILLGLAGWSWSLADSIAVGIVRSVADEAYILRDQAQTPALINMKVMRGDVIRTGPSGSMGLIFDDDTVVSMGPESELVIDEFLFNPSEKKLSFVARMIQGTFTFLSGQITKLAPDSVRLQTPDATVGLRGTHVLVQIDGR